MPTPTPVPDELRALARWDRFVDGIRDCGGLTESERREAEAGYAALRRFLGERWLDEAATRWNPLLPGLHDRAPWRIKWNAALGRDLDVLKAARVPGYGRLRRLFLDPGRAIGAAEQARLAARYLRHGYRIELEPAVPGGRADLLLTSPARAYLEMKEVNESEHSAEWHQLYAALTFSVIQDESVPGGGRVDRVLDLDEMRALWAEVRGALGEIAGGRREPVRLAKEGAYEFWFATREAYAQVPEEFRHRPMPGFPWPTRDAGHRAMTRALEAPLQLPRDHDGVVVVHLRDPISGWAVFTAQPELIAATQEVFRSHPHVLAVAYCVSALEEGAPGYFRSDGAAAHFYRCDDVLMDSGLVVPRAPAELPALMRLLHPLAGIAPTP